MTAWQNESTAGSRRERSKRELEQVSVGLASQALQEIEGSDPERSVLLALEALEHYPYTWQAERALRQVVLKNRLRMVLNHEDHVMTAQWSSDGAGFSSCGEDKTLRVWDALGGEELWCISKGAPIQLTGHLTRNPYWRSIMKRIS